MRSQELVAEADDIMEEDVILDTLGPYEYGSGFVFHDQAACGGQGLV